VLAQNAALVLASIAASSKIDNVDAHTAYIVEILQSVFNG